MIQNSANITVFGGYDEQQIDVLWQQEVVLDIDATLFYIKSGEKEIQAYVDNVAKPDIEQFTQNYAEPIVAKVVTAQSAALIDSYVETTAKPQIDTYAAEVLDTYKIAAAESAENASAAAAQAQDCQTQAAAQAQAASASATTAAEQATAASANASAAAESATAAEQTLAGINYLVAADLGTIAVTPWGIDESENKYRYLNGQTLIQDQFAAFTTKVKSWQTTRPSLFCTEAEWQAVKTASRLGQCGKFVVDDTAGTIRLPAVINLSGLADLSACGLLQAESLPNISGQVYASNITQDFSGQNAGFSRTEGAFTTEQLGGTWGSSWQNSGGLYKLNASLSSAAYQDGAAVRQEAVQYPYAICVNTGIQEAARPINNYQVNNVYAYGMNQYCQGQLNNSSWLKSAGQWNSGGVYNGLYTWATAQLAAEADGFAAADGEYSDYDFVVNATEQTFRLPLKNGSEMIPGTTYTNDVFPALSQTAVAYTAPADGWIYLGVLTTNGSLHVFVNGHQVATDGSATAARAYIHTFVNKGDVISAKIEVAAPSEQTSYFQPAVGNGNLYYYCGDTLQNAQLINVARQGEQITALGGSVTELGNRRYVAESYVSGTNWYRLWSDGWLEQGGQTADIANATAVSLLKPFANADYNLQITSLTAATDRLQWGGTKSATAFTITLTGGAGTRPAMWRACGQSA